MANQQKMWSTKCVCWSRGKIEKPEQAGRTSVVQTGRTSMVQTRRTSVVQTGRMSVVQTGRTSVVQLGGHLWSKLEGHLWSKRFPVQTSAPTQSAMNVSPSYVSSGFCTAVCQLTDRQALWKFDCTFLLPFCLLQRLLAAAMKWTFHIFQKRTKNVCQMDFVLLLFCKSTINKFVDLYL